MANQQTCSDCGKLSPQTDTNYTLISSTFGWRLARESNGTPEPTVKWRCPDCWRKHRETTGEAGRPPRSKR